MNLSEIILISHKSLFANKVRSFLTILGVVIGVSAVILLISLGKGIENYIAGQFEALGSNLVFVSPGRVSFSGDPSAAASRNKLEEKHLDLIRRNVDDNVINVAPYLVAGDTIKYKTKSYYASVQGDDYTEEKMGSIVLDKGRFFTKGGVQTKAREAVIGYLINKEFFGNKNPLGEKIKINGQSFEIIGTLAEKGRNFDELIRIPYTTHLETFGIKNLSGIGIKVKDEASVEPTIKKIEKIMLRELKEDEFTVLSQKDLLSSIQNILRALTLVLSAIAGISLLVGGIGIMNIMLVTVTERTREIGLRKALGATPRDISLQFLLESVLLSMGGGSVGVALGWLASLGARKFIQAEVPLSAVILAFSVSALVGIIFGTYPAFKAAKKDPIESLRYE